jgi:hypothetical protein
MDRTVKINDFRHRNGTVKDRKIKKVGEYQEYDIGMILPKKKKRYWYDYIQRIDILTQLDQKHKD